MDYRYVYFYLEGDENCIADFERSITSQYSYIQISYGVKNSNVLIEISGEKEFEKLEELTNDLRVKFDGKLAVDMRLEC